MGNRVKDALRALHEARSMELGEQRMDELFDAVRRNPEEAVELYATQPECLLQLVWAMQGAGDPCVIPVLKDALGNREKYVRWAAIEALRHFDDPGLVPTFACAARDRSPMVRSVATEWLESHGHPVPAWPVRVRARKPRG